MAFDINTFARVTSSANTKAPVHWSYLSASDNAATIKGSAYFNTKANDLKIGDAIYIYASDPKAQILKVTAVSPNVTTAQIAGDA